MSAPQGHLDFAGYLLDTLDGSEKEKADLHLAECDTCRREVAALRAVETSLDGIPAELFVDGPDDDADLLVERTLHAARAESGGTQWRRNLLLGGAVAAALVAGLGAGTMIGRGDPDDQAAPAPTSTSASFSAPSRLARTRAGSATDPVSHASLMVTVTLAEGWVRVEAVIRGVPAGNRCRLVVFGRGGARETAGGWAVSPTAARDGLTVTGAALIAPADLIAVAVVSITGRTLVTVHL